MTLIVTLFGVLATLLNWGAAQVSRFVLRVSTGRRAALSSLGMSQESTGFGQAAAVWAGLLGSRSAAWALSSSRHARGSRSVRVSLAEA